MLAIMQAKATITNTHIQEGRDKEKRGRQKGLGHFLLGPEFWSQVAFGLLNLFN